MRVLVTGATGYVGHRLMGRIDGAEALPRVDLTDPEQVEAALSPFRWDAVVNAAGPAPKGLPEWSEARDSATVHVRIAMNLARSVPAACRLVHLSSLVVYGMPESRPVSEEHPRKPTHVYGLAKRLAEDAFAGRPDTWLIRCGGLFSEERTDGALYHFLRAAKEGRPLRVTAPAPVAWDPLHVDDAVEAVRRALEVPGHGPLNVSSGEPSELLAIARRIAGRYGSLVSDVAHVEHPVFQCDVSKLERCFGWVPRPLDDRLDAWWRSA